MEGRRGAPKRAEEKMPRQREEDEEVEDAKRRKRKGKMMRKWCEVRRTAVSMRRPLRLRGRRNHRWSRNAPSNSVSERTSPIPERECRIDKQLSLKRGLYQYLILIVALSSIT